MSKKTLKLSTLTLSPGEFFDRFTILVRKAKHEKDYEKRVDELVSILNKNGLPGELIHYICLLQMTNTDIWNMEYDIRMGKEGTLGEREVGRRALAIREENKHRIKGVNSINELFGDLRKETKFEHASQ